MAREMKDSGIEWIGEIPRDWRIDKTIRIFKTIGSGTTPKSTDDAAYDGTIHWIQSGDINGGLLSTTKNFVSLQSLQKYSALKIYEKPFIVMAMYGASIGNLSVSNISACVNQACCVLSKPMMNLNYSFYAIKTAKDYLIWKANGGGQPNISQDTVKSMRLPNPPQIVQSHIAFFLDSKCAEIDTVLDKTRTSIEEYKKLKQAVITQAVTKGIRQNLKMKDSGVKRIGLIPESWKITKIKYFLLSVASGLSAITGDDTSDESGFYVLRTSAVSTGVFKLNERKAVLNNAVNRLVCPVEPDTLIMSRMNTAAMVGYCAYVESECPNTFLPDKLWKIKTKDSLLTKFAWYLINSTTSHNWFASLATGTSLSMLNVSLPDFYNLVIPLPSIGEQQEIAAYLDEKCAAIDTLIDKKEQFLTELENYKKSLIYEYVTGKKEVPDTWQLK